MEWSYSVSMPTIYQQFLYIFRHSRLWHVVFIRPDGANFFHEELGSADSTIPNLVSLLTVVGSNRMLFALFSKYNLSVKISNHEWIDKRRVTGHNRGTVIWNIIFIIMEATMKSFSFPYEEIFHWNLRLKGTVTWNTWHDIYTCR